jgi:hypothetical protein
MVDRIELSTEQAQEPVMENSPANGENSTPETPQRPEWLPEKFNSPEDLAKAYAELERKQGQGKPEETVEQVVENAGLNLQDLTTEFDETGSLSDDSYAKLEQVGISREYVDAYIQGQQALIDQYQTNVFNTVGGWENYQRMIEWAGRNLDEKAITAFNKSINSGDLNQALFSVKGLYSQFAQSEGNEPNLISGNVGQDGGSAFRSTSELVQAMRDPRYQSDPAYRKQVADQLARSSII